MSVTTAEKHLEVLEGLISDFQVEWTDTTLNLLHATGRWDVLPLWSSFRDACKAQIKAAPDLPFLLATWTRITRKCLEYQGDFYYESSLTERGTNDDLDQTGHLLGEQAAASLKAFEYFQGTFKSFQKP